MAGKGVGEVKTADIRALVEQVWQWANKLHAGCDREDSINPDMRRNKVELQLIAGNSMDIMMSCTCVLDALDAIEDALDEMAAADRSNFKRDQQMEEE
jgi:hypothetical protein